MPSHPSRTWSAPTAPAKVEAVGRGGGPLAARATGCSINPGLSCGHCAACEEGEESLCSNYAILGEHLPGTAAELVVVPAANLGRIPDGMSWPEAAGFTLATLTAWRMLTSRAKLQAGETVLIWGVGGGVGMAALQIAVLLGARRDRHQRLRREARGRGRASAPRSR